MMEPPDVITELEAQVRRYDPDRYPVQHATAQFHLGSTLHASGQHDAAEAALAVAVAGFDATSLPREHGVACNALGTLLRDTGRAELASQLFQRAVAVFRAAEARSELGAAWFNLGLARRDLGDRDAAVEALGRAAEHLDAASVPAAAGAAARELGACHLEAGELEAALEALDRAVELAERANDPLGAGAAENVRGLARLAGEDLRGAVEAFERAAANLPRTTQPAAHGMALANLALALERAGEGPRARLAAAQAGAIADVDEPVREQADAILDRLGPPAEDLHLVLDDEEQARWPAIVRAEVARWASLGDPAARVAALDGWIDGQLARPADGVARAAALVGAFLETPPAALEQLVDATVEAARARDEEAHDRFRQQVSRALARYPIPQWMRLKELFATASGDTRWG